MTRHAKRVDANHADIREGLRQLGYDVLDLSGAGCGVPDLCCRMSPGRSLWLEVKRPDIKKADQALTPAQEDWWRFNWRSTRIVQTLDEAVYELTLAKEKP